MSDQLSESKQKTKLEKKLGDVHSGFTSMVEGLTKSDLEKQMFTLAKYREDVSNGLREHAEIISVSEQLKELKAPFNDQLNALKLKLQYVNIILTEKYSQPTQSDKEALEAKADELLGD